MDLISDEERLEIKAVTRQAMRDAGGVEVFASVAGVGKATLSKYGSISEPDSFIRADIMLAHARELGAPMLIEHIARMAGYRLVPIDGGPDGGVSIADVTALATDGGAVLHKLSSALEDGVIDPHEKREIRASISRKITTLHRIDRKVAGA
jgi:hypothetical protein